MWYLARPIGCGIVLTMASLVPATRAQASQAVLAPAGRPHRAAGPVAASLARPAAHKQGSRNALAQRRGIAARSGVSGGARSRSAQLRVVAKAGGEVLVVGSSGQTAARIVVNLLRAGFKVTAGEDRDLQKQDGTAVDMKCCCAAAHMLHHPAALLPCAQKQPAMFCPPLFVSKELVPIHMHIPGVDTDPEEAAEVVKFAKVGGARGHRCPCVRQGACLAAAAAGPNFLKWFLLIHSRQLTVFLTRLSSQYGSTAPLFPLLARNGGVTCTPDIGADIGATQRGKRGTQRSLRQPPWSLVPLQNSLSHFIQLAQCLVS